jgi:hypothetical protein
LLERKENPGDVTGALSHDSTRLVYRSVEEMLKCMKRRGRGERVGDFGEAVVVWCVCVVSGGGGNDDDVCAGRAW